MITVTTNRRSDCAGGLFVRSDDTRGGEEALLVLSDGSVWKGRSVGSGVATAGDVRVVDGLAAVGKTGLLSGLDLNSFQRHLTSRTKAGEGAAVRGCITAAGATYPVHAAVALAMARGEIGRP